MFWGNSFLAYLIFVSILFMGFLVVKIFEHILIKHLKKWAEKTITTFDDFVIRAIKRIGVPLAYFGVFYLGIDTLTLNPLFKKIINIAAIGILTLAAVRFGIALISYGFEFYLSKREENSTLKRSLDGILVVIKVVIWGLAIVYFLDNLGFKITAVIAGLGIGGVAVALAAQAVLGDLFSYFAILFDRPFEIGDFIIIGDHLGTVENIGIKTTRIRSLSGEQLIFSNTDLTNSRVRNYKRMEKRRVVFKLGVTYQTTSKQVKAIPKIIENIIKNVGDTIFDRAHFLSYGDFALIFEIVYYVLGSDYNKYMDIQQEINFAIKEKFEAEHIDFAYPTQTLYVTKAPA
ncbi:MAG: mechanosensitive ion channel family protein [Candidatus Omnitrophica bacterium]|nr:mechanosensitive ion channel family protein [Candidatus Omnitrophota bacterium]MBU1928264.1 mechanosensitive ion channel family protein [Candidatus Omnitrophota bacterium]MBU2035422.1 mechanosensitive ion channel family protein [Candidatus Omnitrophota bacterium]MBU2258907.1 mechanosensitive ion channel family protein [Candidatus Omnitrophota bacterium]